MPKMSPIPEAQQRCGAYPGKGEISDAGRERLREIGQTLATAIKTDSAISAAPIHRGADHLLNSLHDSGMALVSCR